MPHEVAEDPRILAVKACAQDSLGSDQLAQILLARAQTMAAALTSPAELGQYPDLEWHLGFAEMVLLDDRAHVIAVTDRVWSLLGEGVEIETHSRAAAFHHIGWAYLRHRGSPERGIQALTFAVRESTALGDTVLRNRATRHLAFILAWVGKIRAAQQALSRVDDLPEPVTSWQLNSVGDVQAAEAYIAYLNDDLELAKKSISNIKGSDTQVVSFTGTARFLFILTAAASRDPSLMRRAALELQHIPRQDSRGVSWEAFHRMCQAVLSEATGGRDRALAIARKFSGTEDMPLVIVVLAGILRRAGQVNEALGMLQNLRNYQQLSYVRVATLSTGAISSSLSGNPAAAHELLELALEAAEEEGICRPFCEWDLELRKLLTEHLAWGTRYSEFITGCFSQKTESHPLHELSKRERLVLAQLRTTRTLAEIAEALGVSPNTVKTQAGSIYRKLGVKSRKEAISVVVEDALGP
ncbi:helix-turn-helix domain-containing protein [Leucobacter sp. HY1908]